MATAQAKEIQVQELLDVHHNSSTGMIVLSVKDGSGADLRVIMPGELADRLHAALGNALQGASQNPAAP